MHALSIAEAQEIDTSVVPDIHAYLAGLRTNGPIARSKMGFIVALRHQHLDLITRPQKCQIAERHQVRASMRAKRAGGRSEQDRQSRERL
jgi:hypothetical protein